jgi:NDP-sugar pyrophosphorylase family protein
MKPSLVILAAGMASRYGSMKQVEGFGPSGETIMDYSIYDAIRAGFGKVVFIIRKEFEKNFREIVGKDIEPRIQVEYVFQELNKYSEGFQIPADRTKPWGTAHAVLCADEKVKETFAVINADDFYGKDSFEKAYKFLVNDCNPKAHSIIGYELLNTLSEHGTVNRGVCEVDDRGNLVSVVERLNVSREGDHVVCNDEHSPKELSLDTPVSMNFWCFDPSVFDYTKGTFKEFLSQNASNPKAEFFIPIVADKYIKEGEGVIKVIPTSAKWFGVTYKEDAPMVRASLRKLVDAGDYPENLWAK